MMNAITIRNLSDEISRALEARAIRNGTTAEAEAEQILHDALAVARNNPSEQSKPPLKLGTALWELGQEFGGLDDLDFSRDQTPAKGVSFE